MGRRDPLEHAPIALVAGVLGVMEVAHPPLEQDGDAARRGPRARPDLSSRDRAETVVKKAYEAGIKKLTNRRKEKNQ